MAAETARVSLRSKLSFGIGCVGRDATYTLVSNFILTYHTLGVGISNWQLGVVGVIMVAARKWDAVYDPIMGTIIDNTRSRAWCDTPRRNFSTLRGAAALHNQPTHLVYRPMVDKNGFPRTKENAKHWKAGDEYWPEGYLKHGYEHSDGWAIKKSPLDEMPYSITHTGQIEGIEDDLPMLYANQDDPGSGSKTLPQP